MRLIDADETKKDFNLNFGSVFHAVCANRIVDRQPTIDAVPVVRCKDCKHRGSDSACPMYHEEWVSTIEDGYHDIDTVEYDNTEDDNFCSYGERKDGAEDG